MMTPEQWVDDPTLPSVDPVEQMTEEALPDVWAMWCGVPPPRTRPGCPVTGWVHESSPPWRVIASRDPFTLPMRSYARPYTGDEPTVDVAEWLAGQPHD